MFCGSQIHHTFSGYAQVPLDGEIVEGEAMVSSELITGESLPVHRKPGDELPAGAINLDGSLVMKATQAAEDSTPARMARLATEAQVSHLHLA